MIRILLALSAFAFISCDRHEWEGEDGTNRLFMSHDDHDSHSAHGDTHDDHGKKDSHTKEEKGH